MAINSFKALSRTTGTDIVITHVPTNTVVSFPSFVSEFSDTYTVTFGDEQIFGRNDPIKPYRGTTRQISLGFDVVSEDLKTAKQNLNNATLFARMMYPVYSPRLEKGLNTGRTIKAPPIMRVKYANLIQNTAGSGRAGLLGTISGFAYKPTIVEAGAFLESGEIIPKSFSISFTFSVLHEDTVGWNIENNKFLLDQYPYGTTTIDASNPTDGEFVRDKEMNDAFGYENFEGHA